MLGRLLQLKRFQEGEEKGPRNDRNRVQAQGLPADLCHHERRTGPQPPTRYLHHAGALRHRDDAAILCPNQLRQRRTKDRGGLGEKAGSIWTAETQKQFN